MFERIFIFGHRGAKGLVPENTVQSCERGIVEGVDGLEVDCQPCQDSDIIIHDRFIMADPSHDVLTAIRDLSFQSIQTICLRENIEVPTLAQLLPYAKRIHLNIEWKCETFSWSAIKTVTEWMQQNPERISNLLFSSFSLPLLKEAKKQFPEIRRAVLLYGIPLSLNEIITQIAPVAINCGVDFLPDDFIAAVKGAGLSLNVYTVNDVELARTLKARGIDGIFTDFPDRFRPS